MLKSIALLLRQPIIQTLLVFIGVMVMGTPIYPLIDDVHIARMLSGAYTGAPYEYVHAIHIYLSSFIVFLYNFNSTVNWYTLILYFVLFVSLYATCLALAPFVRRKNPAGILSLLFVLLIYIYAISQIQYVTVGGLSIFSGLLLFLSASRNNNLRISILVLSLFLICAGFMLREGMAYFAALIVAPATYYRYIRSEAGSQKPFAMFLLLVVGCIFILKCAQSGAYDAYPEIKEDRLWFTTQIEYSNFYLYHYMFHPDLYSSVGWSANDYAMYDSWSFQDNQIFTQDKISRVMAEAIRKPPSAPQQMAYIYNASIVNLLLGGGTYLWIAYVFVGMSLMLLKRERRMIVLTFLVFVTSILYFSYLIRIVPYRVTIPAALFLGTFIPVSTDLVIRFKREVTLVLFYTVAIALLVLVAYEYHTETKSNSEKIKRFSRILRQIPQRDEAIIYLWDSAIPINWTSPFDDYSILKKYALAGGGWPQRLEPERELFRQYGVTYLYKDVYEKDNILVIANDEHLTFYHRFMKEHYNINVEFQVLSDFTRYEMDKTRYGYGGKLVKIRRIN
jgi:hypothetical protein